MVGIALTIPTDTREWRRHLEREEYQYCYINIVPLPSYRMLHIRTILRTVPFSRLSSPVGCIHLNPRVSPQLGSTPNSAHKPTPLIDTCAPSIRSFSTTNSPSPSPSSHSGTSPPSVSQSSKPSSTPSASSASSSTPSPPSTAHQRWQRSKQRALDEAAAKAAEKAAAMKQADENKEAKNESSSFSSSSSSSDSRSSDESGRNSESSSSSSSSSSTSKPRRTLSDYTLAAVVVANAYIYILWSSSAGNGELTWSQLDRLNPKSHQLLKEHFRVSIENLEANRWWTLVTSSFTHYRLDHLCANMAVFLLFARGVMKATGLRLFMPLYMCGGIIASYTSVMVEEELKKRYPTQP